MRGTRLDEAEEDRNGADRGDVLRLEWCVGTEEEEEGGCYARPQQCQTHSPPPAPPLTMKSATALENFSSESQG